MRATQARCWYTCGSLCQALQWRHNGCDSVSNHQPHDCLLNLLFRRRSKKTSKLRVTGLCAWNSLVTGEVPAQMDSYAENVSIWWRHHVYKNIVSVWIHNRYGWCRRSCLEFNERAYSSWQCCWYHESTHCLVVLIPMYYELVCTICWHIFHKYFGRHRPLYCNIFCMKSGS